MPAKLTGSMCSIFLVHFFHGVDEVGWYSDMVAEDIKEASLPKKCKTLVSILVACCSYYSKFSQQPVIQAILCACDAIMDGGPCGWEMSHSCEDHHWRL